jgi:catechol 2,3-dioxygenase-like lactoylglutathione lyase family enzyme
MADLKLEVVVLPVADVDRAKDFYEGLGWRLDADIGDGEEFRIVQFTPPGSDCSIHFGVGVTPADPGTGVVYLIVSDLDEARKELADRGADVSDTFHREDEGRETPGPDPEGRSYFSLASFNDPDGNRWLLQEITERLPGRV